MTTLLSIDTSTEACSIALLYKNTITHDFILSQRDHTKQILPMIDKLLSESDCPLSTIDAIVFGQGPGSFTGVRIGIGVAQGLAFGLERPLIGVSSLMALAQGAYRICGATKVIAAIDARMSEVYLGGYQRSENGRWSIISDECVIKPELVSQYLNNKTGSSNEIYSAGTGFQAYPSMIDKIKESGFLLPHSQDMLTIASILYDERQLISAQDVEPTYLRNEVTWKKLPGRE